MKESLKNYAAFLIDNKLEEFCLFQQNLLEKFDLEFLKQFEHIPAETRLEASKKEQLDFLESVKNENAIERLKKNLDRWESNEIEEVDNQDIGEVELDAFLSVQKHALVKFLSDFTSDPFTISELCQEIVSFYGTIERESYKTFARIKNAALEEVKALSLELNSKNEELLSSLRCAQGIQRGLMKDGEELLSTYEGFLLFKPKDIVSGDFFWMNEFKDSTLFCVGDCTGHGVPGALLTAVSLGLLQRCAIENRKDPAEVLNYLHKEFNSRFSKSEGAQEGLDVGLCLIDRSNDKIVISGACQLIYIQNGKEELIPVATQRKSIGSTVFTDLYENVEFQLSQVSKIYLQSDGYRDQIGGEKLKTLRRHNYKKLLESGLHLSMQEQKLELEKFLENWMGNNEQMDDICILGISL